MWLISLERIIKINYKKTEIVYSLILVVSNNMEI